jgi:hypothetical protein
MSNLIARQFHEQWKTTASWITGRLDSFTDDELALEIAPGKNHGVWILGHLIESEDDLSKYIGKGEMIFPHYEEIFGQGSILRPAHDYPPVAQLRREWKQVLAKNDALLAAMTDEEWNEPHTQLCAGETDDFFRTKGRCVSIWCLHQMYHCGQLGALTLVARAMPAELAEV